MTMFNEIFDSLEIPADVPHAIRKVTEPSDGQLPTDDPLYAFYPSSKTLSKNTRDLLIFDEVEQIAGPSYPSALFEVAELAKLNQERQFSDLLVKSGRAGLLVKKHIQRGETPQEAMQYAVDLFSDKFTPDCLDKAKRAIKALDLASFLQLLTNAMTGD
jgi:hypothetical protein